ERPREARGIRGEIAFESRNIDPQRSRHILGAGTHLLAGDRRHRATPSLSWPERDRSVGIYFVLLGLRLRLVLFVDILDRAFAHELARQDHHAYEATGFVRRGLCKHRVRPGFIPGAARAERGRTLVRVDADAALDQAADSRPLMAMLVSTAAGRESDAVAAHQQLAFRQRLEKGSEFFVRGHAGRVRGGATLVAARKLPAPAGDATRARLHRDSGFALPGLTLIEHRAGDLGRAMHDENESR